MAAEKRAWRLVRTDFLRRLLSRELIAFAYVTPVRTEGRSRIPPDWWNFLRPNFRNSSAEGGGCNLVDIRIYSAVELEEIDPEGSAGPRDKVSERADVNARAELPSPADYPAPRRVGHPGYITQAREEVRRLAREEQLPDTLTQLVDYILDWVLRNVTHAANWQKAPSREYIRRQLRPLYNELKGQKSGIHSRTK